jgi:hypothetical protein
VQYNSVTSKLPIQPSSQRNPPREHIFVEEPVGYSQHPTDLTNFSEAPFHTIGTEHRAVSKQLLRVARRL